MLQKICKHSLQKDWFLFYCHFWGSHDGWRKLFDERQRFFFNLFILRHLERGIKPILTPHDGRRHFGLSGIRTCVHQHGSPHHHCAQATIEVCSPRKLHAIHFLWSAWRVNEYHTVWETTYSSRHRMMSPRCACETDRLSGISCSEKKVFLAICKHQYQLLYYQMHDVLCAVFPWYAIS